MNTIMLSVVADDVIEAVEACRRLCHLSGVTYWDTVKVDPVRVVRSDVFGDYLHTVGYRVTFTVDCEPSHYYASEYVAVRADMLEHVNGLITEVPL